MKVISNSSPLIGLSSIRKLDILKVVWGSVIIPQAVFHEVVILGENKTGSKEDLTPKQRFGVIHGNNFIS